MFYIFHSQEERRAFYGGAMLAMVGCNKFKSIDECANSLVEIKKTIHPDKEIASRYEARYNKFKNIYPSSLSGLIYNLDEIYIDKEGGLK